MVPTCRLRRSMRAATSLFVNVLFYFCVVAVVSSQNFETFYPFAPVLPPAQPPQLAADPPITPATPPATPGMGTAVAKAVAATAAITMVIAGILFFTVQRCVAGRQRRSERGGAGSSGIERVVPLDDDKDDILRNNADLGGMIVDENGLDVVYWRELEEGGNMMKKNGFSSFGNEGTKSSTSSRQVWSANDQVITTVTQPAFPESPAFVPSTSLLPSQTTTSCSSLKQPTRPLPLPPRAYVPNKANVKTESPATSLTSPKPPHPPPPSKTTLVVPKKQKNPSPPPLRPSPKKNVSSSPPPPPPPPPPPKAKGFASALKPSPPPLPKQKSSGQGSKAERSNQGGEVKLKPLHWDKVSTTNNDHSMVWDKIDGGSFRFDGDLMEALFGFVAKKKDMKSPQRRHAAPNKENTPAARIFILDPRKSQNTAIVLRSITIPRREILDALMEGHGLSPATVEKLARIAPTKEEESEILGFRGDPTTLADAESFLFHLLKPIPSAFPRLQAMLFRLNFARDVLLLKESLQTIELGCKELRTTRGRLFHKLLEAILKAGNRMNAGTTRGNAQAFDLTSLPKLADVKSTDGKTTLLHFVVGQVVRSEGKRCVLNRSRSSRRGSLFSGNPPEEEEEDREKEYIMLGLPEVGGLSAAFSNLKKATAVDRNSLATTTTSALRMRADEIRQLLLLLEEEGEEEESAACGGSVSRRGGFAGEMERFLEAADGELGTVSEEQRRVMELVKRTTEYYQPGASKDTLAVDPLHLFEIVKKFLGTVDQACVDVSRNLQRRRSVKGSGGSSSPAPAPLPESRMAAVRFPNLPVHFMSFTSNSGSTSSDSTDTDDF